MLIGDLPPAPCCNCWPLPPDHSYAPCVVLGSPAQLSSSSAGASRPGSGTGVKPVEDLDFVLPERSFRARPRERGTQRESRATLMALPFYFSHQKAEFNRRVMSKNAKTRHQPFFISGAKDKRRLVSLRKLLWDRWKASSICATSLHRRVYKASAESRSLKDSDFIQSVTSCPGTLLLWAFCKALLSPFTSPSFACWFLLLKPVNAPLLSGCLLGRSYKENTFPNIHAHCWRSSNICLETLCLLQTLGPPVADPCEFFKAGFIFASSILR